MTTPLTLREAASTTAPIPRLNDIRRWASEHDALVARCEALTARAERAEARTAQMEAALVDIAEKPLAVPRDPGVEDLIVAVGILVTRAKAALSGSPSSLDALRAADRARVAVLLAEIEEIHGQTKRVAGNLATTMPVAPDDVLIDVERTVTALMSHTALLLDPDRKAPGIACQTCGGPLSSSHTFTAGRVECDRCAAVVLRIPLPFAFASTPAAGTAVLDAIRAADRARVAELVDGINAVLNGPLSWAAEWTESTMRQHQEIVNMLTTLLAAREPAPPKEQ